jgi:glycosyltransferase involved in cell wall biosynthesis
MIKDILEIILITYNRRDSLEKTLQQIFSPESPIKDLQITVLNNNSTDGSAELIEEYVTKFKNFKQIINKKNIGGNPNLIRAYEEAQKEYIWVICDDDYYDWTAWANLVNILSKKPDVICVADYALQGNKSVAALLMQMTFVPAGIFKSSLITEDILKNAYDNVHTMFPQLTPLIHAINNKMKIEILPKPLVFNGMNMEKNDYSYNRGHALDNIFPQSQDMSWIMDYAIMICGIKNKKLRQQSFEFSRKYIIGSFEKFINEVTMKYAKLSEFHYVLQIIQHLTPLKKAYFLFRYFMSFNPIIDFYETDRGINIKLFRVIKTRIYKFRNQNK